MRIESAIYLEAMLRDVLRFGGRTVIREFSSTHDLMSLTETLIVNCTGLGSRDLFQDEEMTPLKGQLTLLDPQEGVDYATVGGLESTSGEPGIGLHMMSRRDGIALGGTAERGEWSLEPNEESMKRIVDGHAELFGAMRAPWKTT
jgi:D-amino-acid oxidase